MAAGRRHGSKYAIYDEGDVLIAYVTFAPKGLDYDVHPAQGRPLTEVEQHTVYVLCGLRNWGRSRSLKGWKSRRERQQLRSLYALMDNRESLRLPESPVDLERLYALDDPRT